MKVKVINLHENGNTYYATKLLNVHSLDILCLSTNINIHPERKVCLSVKLTFMQTRTYKQVCSWPGDYVSFKQFCFKYLYHFIAIVSSHNTAIICWWRWSSVYDINQRIISNISVINNTQKHFNINLSNYCHSTIYFTAKK